MKSIYNVVEAIFSQWEVFLEIYNSMIRLYKGIQYWLYVSTWETALIEETKFLREINLRNMRVPVKQFSKFDKFFLREINFFTSSFQVYL